MAAVAVSALSAACSGVGANLPQSAPASPQVASLAVPATAGAATPEAPTTPPPGDAVIAPAPEHFDGPPPAPKPPPRHLTGSQPAKAAGTWAVVIGVNDYPGVAHDLRSAVADAEDVNVALAGMGVPADHRLVLKDGQVTGKVLRSAAGWLAERAGPDAVAVFFFAGHVRKVSASTEAMVAADGSTVTDAELAGLLRGLQARRSWIVVAACYGGGFTEVLRPGVVLTGASPSDKEAYENVSFGRSYLVQYMVREAMIDGRAADTVQSAFEYARASIARDYPHRVPVQFDQAGAPLDLRPPGAARPAPAPQKVHQPPPTTSTTAAPPRKQEQPASDSPAERSTTTTTAPTQGACNALTRVVRCTSG